MTRLLERLSERLRRLPAATLAALAAVLLVIAGVVIIAQSEAAYRQEKQQETQVQADILAASVTAALDFGDSAAAQEAAEAMRVNKQVRGAAVYDRTGRRIAGYRRDGLQPMPTLAASRAYPSPAVVAEVPVLRDGQRIGTVRLGTDPQPLAARVGRYLLIGLLMVMAALVVVVLGIAQAALGRANRELAARAAALADANAQLKVEAEERARAEDQLRQVQKMQALGQLTGGIAHDFNNLLTVIQGSADMLTRPGVAEERRRRYADAVVQAAGRAAALTGQLLAFARRQPLQPEIVDVNAMLHGMTELLDRTLGELVEVRTDLADGVCAVEADRAQLASAVLNIAVNARDAMPEGGTLTLSTRRYDGPFGPMIALAIADTGGGMDEETLARATEPFFTTKVAGKGTGLGLSQVYGFASQSGGDLTIDSVAGRGTTVTIHLPESDEPLGTPTEAAPTAEPKPTRIGSVLLVEDNDEVGEFAETMLRELGHEVTRARSGAEAVTIAADRRFDLVFTDVVMPAMSGLELAETLEARWPGMPVVLTTGYSDEIATSGTGGRPVLLKPYRLEALAAILDEALAATAG